MNINLVKNTSILTYRKYFAYLTTCFFLRLFTMSEELKKKITTEINCSVDDRDVIGFLLLL